MKAFDTLTARELAEVDKLVRSMWRAKTRRRRAVLEELLQIAYDAGYDSGHSDGTLEASERAYTH